MGEIVRYASGIRFHALRMKQKGRSLNRLQNFCILKRLPDCKANRHGGNTQVLVFFVVSRLGLEPRALALNA